MIIDVHTHINNYHEDRVVSLEECLNKLTENMLENKVDYFAVAYLDEGIALRNAGIKTPIFNFLDVF